MPDFVVPFTTRITADTFEEAKEISEKITKQITDLPLIDNLRVYTLQIDRRMSREDLSSS